MERNKRFSLHTLDPITVTPWAILVYITLTPWAVTRLNSSHALDWIKIRLFSFQRLDSTTLTPWIGKVFLPFVICKYIQIDYFTFIPRTKLNPFPGRWDPFSMELELRLETKLYLLPLRLDKICRLGSVFLYLYMESRLHLLYRNQFKCSSFIQAKEWEESSLVHGVGIM